MVALVGSLGAVMSVGAILLALVSFRFVFPRHTVKVRDGHILPFGFPLIFCSSAPLVWLLLTRIVPNESAEPSAIFSDCLYLLKEQPGLIFYLLFCIALIYFSPAILVYWFAKILHKGWRISSYRRDYKRVVGKWPRRSLKWRLPWYDLCARFVNDHVLNEFGKLTAYSETLEELMIDVRTTDRFLFCGKFADYHLEDGKFSGVSMSNVLRFNHYNETTLSHEKESDGERIYLFPNDGRIFFPHDKIQDIHFWRIRHRYRFYRELSSIKDARLLAWWLSLQWAIPTMKIQVSTKVRSGIDVSVGREIILQLERFNLSPDKVQLKFENEKK